MNDRFEGEEIACQELQRVVVKINVLSTIANKQNKR
jgi:hypothetical protein